MRIQFLRGEWSVPRLFTILIMEPYVHSPVSLCGMVIKHKDIFLFFMVRQPLVDQGLIIEAHHHTQNHHTLYDSSGRVISPMRRPLPENTPQSQETDIHASVGFEPTVPASERPQTDASVRGTTWIIGTFPLTL